MQAAYRSAQLGSYEGRALAVSVATAGLKVPGQPGLLEDGVGGVPRLNFLIDRKVYANPASE